MTIQDKHILIIEDDVDFLNKIVLVLNSEGFYNITGVQDCSSALKFIEDNSETFIITEYSFTGMDGEALLKKLKRRLNGSMKVIVLSRSQVLADSFKVLSLGALAFINKTEPKWQSLLNQSLTSWIQHFDKQNLIRDQFLNYG